MFRLGPSTVNTISKDAAIDRAETYRVVTRLQEKGYLQKVYEFPIKIKAVPMCNIFSLQIQKKRKELLVIEKEAKRLIELEDTGILPLKNEYIMLLPRAEKAFEEIRREIKNVKRSILIVSSIKNFITMGLMPWGNIYKPLLEKGVEIIRVLNESCPKEKFSDPYNYARYSNYSLRCISHADHMLPQVDLVIHDYEKVWLKTSVVDVPYDKSSWIFSNNPNLVALATCYFNKIIKYSEKI